MGRTFIVVGAAVGAFLAWGGDAHAAVCDDHANQADAQHAADTRDADGDGVYCESLPCPCSRASGGEGGPRERTTPARRRSAPRPRSKNRRRAGARRYRARIVAVIDGDTVRVRYHRGRKGTRTVRLIGIDTPETQRPGVPVECGGVEATHRMLRLAFTRPRDTDGDGLVDREGGTGRTVTLTTDPTQDTVDRYGRHLGYLTTVGGRDLGRAMLSAGRAKVYVYDGRRFRRHAAYRRASRAARRAKLGAWKGCGGDFHRRR